MNKYIILLQETYIFYCKRDTDIITKEWRGRHFWSFGTCQSQGVGILFSESFQCRIDQNSTHTDREGRILSVSVEINYTAVQVCNIYCPDNATEHSEFLDNLPSYIKGGAPYNRGDWNCVENPQMDKFGGNPHRCTAGLFPLADLWLGRHFPKT